VARTQSLELAANNLANASTTGYRAQQETFRQIYAGRTPVGAVNRAINAYGVLGDPQTDFAQGTLEKTGSLLDFAIEGRGFFVVQTPAGIQYTRDGSFHLAKDRTLLTTAGDAVLGEQGPIRLPEGEISVSADGTISVGGALAGRMRLAEFAAGTELTPAGNAYYNAPAASAIPAVNSQLRQGMLEQSNVQPVAAAVSLIAIQRHAESLQRALYVFHNQFNRIAAEELPRV
jgi:flagellar basal-body rod protein FlgF/flagellar basal-body rod protein FlgG